MGIHSIDQKLPAELYQCWFDRHQPGYPGSTIVEVPRIAANTRDDNGEKVNKTESNPFGAYMVNLTVHIFISEFDKTHLVVCQNVMYAYSICSNPQFAKAFLQPGMSCLFPGVGAGGDLRGAAFAGMNVVGFDNRASQVKAVKEW